MPILLALVTLASPVSADDQMRRMTALYNEVCLKAFPDDKAVEALMTAQNARPLTPDEVKVTMVDDPARGWELQDGTATVWLEFPPYHACSVRWSTPEIGDLRAYRAAAADYENTVGEFQSFKPIDRDRGDIRIHFSGEQRMLPDSSAENLFVIDQSITDAKRRAAGETGFDLRFVHQFTPPGGGGG
jgi:hypothetical protein